MKKTQNKRTLMGMAALLLVAVTLVKAADCYKDTERPCDATCQNWESPPPNGRTYAGTPTSVLTRPHVAAVTYGTSSAFVYYWSDYVNCTWTCEYRDTDPPFDLLNSIPRAQNQLAFWTAGSDCPSSAPPPP